MNKQSNSELVRIKGKNNKGKGKIELRHLGCIDGNCEIIDLTKDRLFSGASGCGGINLKNLNSTCSVCGDSVTERPIGYPT